MISEKVRVLMFVFFLSFVCVMIMLFSVVLVMVFR